MKQKGFTLLEVLIAGLIITLGLVAVVNVQVASQKRGFETHQKKLAGLYAQDLQVRLNADTCYLSKSNDNGITDLNDFISNNPSDKGLDAFIAKHETEWRNTHFTESRSGWRSDLIAVFHSQDEIAGENELDRKVRALDDNGYWEFELTIKPTSFKEGYIQQSLIVNYIKEGCK